MRVVKFAAIAWIVLRVPIKRW